MASTTQTKKQGSFNRSTMTSGQADRRPVGKRGCRENRDDLLVDYRQQRFKQYHKAYGMPPKARHPHPYSCVHNHMSRIEMNRQSDKNSSSNDEIEVIAGGTGGHKERRKGGENSRTGSLSLSLLRTVLSTHNPVQNVMYRFRITSHLRPDFVADISGLVSAVTTGGRMELASGCKSSTLLEYKDYRRSREETLPGCCGTHAT